MLLSVSVSRCPSSDITALRRKQSRRSSAHVANPRNRNLNCWIHVQQRGSRASTSDRPMRGAESWPISASTKCSYSFKKPDEVLPVTVIGKQKAGCAKTLEKPMTYVGKIMVGSYKHQNTENVRRCENTWRRKMRERGPCAEISKRGKFTVNNRSPV